MWTFLHMRGGDRIAMIEKKFSRFVYKKQHALNYIHRFGDEQKEEKCLSPCGWSFYLAKFSERNISNPCNPTGTKIDLINWISIDDAEYLDIFVCTSLPCLLVCARK